MLHHPRLSPFFEDGGKNMTCGFRIIEGVVVMKCVADVGDDGVEFVIRKVMETERLLVVG